MLKAYNELEGKWEKRFLFWMKWISWKSFWITFGICSVILMGELLGRTYPQLDVLPKQIKYLTDPIIFTLPPFVALQLFFLMIDTYEWFGVGVFILIATTIAGLFLWSIYDLYIKSYDRLFIQDKSFWSWEYPGDSIGNVFAFVILPMGFLSALVGILVYFVEKSTRDNIIKILESQLPDIERDIYDNGKRDGIIEAITTREYLRELRFLQLANEYVKLHCPIKVEAYLNYQRNRVDNPNENANAIDILPKSVISQIKVLSRDMDRFIYENTEHWEEIKDEFENDEEYFPNENNNDNIPPTENDSNESQT
jgi:hypothetical protein